MKANETPEKIYVSNYSSGLTYNWHNERLATNDIEYIRKDAFIEKALKYIKTNVDRIVNNHRAVCMGLMDGEFKKYMGGE